MTCLSDNLEIKVIAKSAFNWLRKLISKPEWKQTQRKQCLAYQCMWVSHKVNVSTELEM